MLLSEIFDFTKIVKILVNFFYFLSSQKCGQVTMKIF